MSKKNKIICPKCGTEVTVPNEFKRQIYQMQEDLQHDFKFQLEQQIIKNTIKKVRY